MCGGRAGARREVRCSGRLVRSSIRIAAAALAAAVPCVPATAMAGASARLVYLRGPGAEDCPGESAVRAAVSSRLGYDPFFPWAHETLFAEIDHHNQTFRGVVKLVDENNLQRGARDLSVKSADCSVVIDALALTISLTIDPNAVMGVAPQPAAAAPEPPDERSPAGAPPAPSPPRAPSPPGAPPPPPPDASLAAPRAPDPPPKTLRDDAPWVFRAGLGTVASINAAPSTTMGFTLSLGAGTKNWSLDVEGRGDLPAGGSTPLTNVEVRTWLLVGSVVPCGHLAFAFACPVATAGAIGATSVGGAVTPHERYGFWWALGGRVGAEWRPADRLLVRGYVEVLATMRLDSLAIDGTPVQFLSPWSGDLGLAFAWRFL
jgi:hypothetical protein